MASVTSFAPIVASGARVLILGSIPGVASLRVGQYYAHPRNAFWAIMAVLTGVPPQAPYHRRRAGLQRIGIAVWDVLRQCVRRGSLDAAIELDSMVANDIPRLIRAHPQLGLICFNGATAEAVFRRQIRAGLGDLAERLQYQRLPSTSPAHAGLSVEEKRRIWVDAIAPWVCSAASEIGDAR